MQNFVHRHHLILSITSVAAILAACSTDSGRRADAEDTTSIEPEIRDVDGRPMALVAGGTFPMGCSVAEYAARNDLGCDDLGSASPVHDVTVPAFRIDVNEVTQAEYQRYLQAKGLPDPGSACEEWDPGTNGTRPYQCADWDDADAFCRFTGNRLCTEAEWEFAARGSDGRRHPWGNDAPTCEHANLLNCTGQPGNTLPVGTHPLGQSPFGVEDMLGNVAEWVEDDYHAGFDGAPVDGSARIDSPRSATSVVKGGNFSYSRSFDANGRTGLEHLPEGGTMNFGPGIRCCRSGLE